MGKLEVIFSFGIVLLLFGTLLPFINFGVETVTNSSDVGSMEKMVVRFVPLILLVGLILAGLRAFKKDDQPQYYYDGQY